MVNLSKIGKGRHITYHPPQEALDIDSAELLGLHASDGYISRGLWSIRCNLQDRNMAKRIIYVKLLSSVEVYSVGIYD
jgi:hypothetical protein